MTRRWTAIAAAIVLAATATIYLAMLLVTLPRLSAIAGAGGLADTRMFDMRPGGYDLETARTLLAALGERGRDEYLNVQQRLDTAFPLLNGLSLFIALSWIGRRIGFPAAAALVLAGVLALASAGFDLAENRAIAALLRAGPDEVDPAAVARASGFSQIKAVAVSISMTLVLAGLIAVAVKHRRKNHVV